MSYEIMARHKKNKEDQRRIGKTKMGASESLKTFDIMVTRGESNPGLRRVINDTKIYS